MLRRSTRSAASAAVPPWRWLWQHCLDSPCRATQLRTFALNVRSAATRFPSQPRAVQPPSTPTPSSTSSASRTPPRPASDISQQLALIDAERAHQPDAALAVLPRLDSESQAQAPTINQQHAGRWAKQLASAATFATALIEYAQSEQWSPLLQLYLEHAFYQPLSSVTFIPSVADSQLAVEAAMELRDWDSVLRIHVRTLVYERRRAQLQGDDAAAHTPDVTNAVKPSTKRRLERAAAVSSTSSSYRARACLDCVLYAAYRLGRHDLVLSLFDTRTAPLPSSHTTYILACAQTRQWERVERWLASVDESVWEELEMEAVHSVLEAWRSALNDTQRRSSNDSAQHEQRRYHQSVARVADWMMRVGAMSTPPQPVHWSDESRIQRKANGPLTNFPLLVRPMMGYVSPLQVTSLSATTHYSEVANMAAVVSLALLRVRSHLLSSASAALFSVYVQPPHSSLTAWDVDACVEGWGIRGMSAFVRGSEMRAVLGGSERRRAEEARRRDESRELFESKGERRRRLQEEEAVRRGDMEEEKQWVLEIDAETQQRWLDKTQLQWERDALAALQAEQHKA